MELTDRYVAELPWAVDASYAARDDLAGFFVAVGKRKKTFTVQCDVRDDLGRRRTKKIAIGNFPDLTVRQARAKAKATLGAIQTAGKFEERRKEWTLGEAWEHMRDFELPRKGSRPRTVEGYDKTVHALMKDWLTVPLRKFADKPHLVEERHHKITRDHGPYSANGYGRTFRRLYRYAQAKLDRTLPPIQWSQVITWNAEKRDHSGMGEEELPGWFAQLAALRNPVRRELHLFLLLSGSRPEALSKARWKDLDLKRRALRIPEPKGGEQRAFSIPLSREMLKSLIRVRKAGRIIAPRQSAEFIFPSPESKPGHIVEWKEDRATLSKWGKQLRQSYVIAAETLDISERALKRLLNHKTQDVTMGYGDRNRMWPRLLADQERISAYIMGQSKAT
ncbi:MAG TPA: integrase arm-type DNA-binding domain-containing protein [Novosphingobium sp.]|nr:integrase arm-type DNA-binding domain-containing protein [Novosphingobium sp.]